jgi:hypothetical protein
VAGARLYAQTIQQLQAIFFTFFSCCRKNSAMRRQIIEKSTPQAALALARALFLSHEGPKLGRNTLDFDR